MSSKKNYKPKNKKKLNKKTKNGFAKLATITTKSISAAFVNYKKRQEQNKIKEIKLKKLQENNELIRDRKELKNLEEKIKKDEHKLKIKEEELKLIFQIVLKLQGIQIQASLEKLR